jgi:hypothetical protein
MCWSIDPLARLHLLPVTTDASCHLLLCAILNLQLFRPWNDLSQSIMPPEKQCCSHYLYFDRSTTRPLFLLVNSIKHSVYYMNQFMLSFLAWKHWIFHTDYNYVVDVILTMIFPKQHYHIGLCNDDAIYFLWDKRWIYIAYIIQMNTVLQRLMEERTILEICHISIYLKNIFPLHTSQNISRSGILAVRVIIRLMVTE